MRSENIHKNLYSEINTKLEKSKLNRLTEDNDYLVRSLKKPGDLFKAA